MAQAPVALSGSGVPGGFVDRCRCSYRFSEVGADRSGRPVGDRTGRSCGRTVAEVARELGCDWHTVNNAVLAYGEALLDADVDRIGSVTALGMDETLFARVGMWRRQLWSTSIVDVAQGVLLDVVPGRGGSEPAAWLAARGDEWLSGIEWATLDLSSPYRAVFDTMLPDATQIADPFHLIKLANSKLDECRRRVQNETLGHRGRKTDPLYRIRRLLTKADERLDDRGRTKLLGLLAAGDPKGEVKTTWHAKEVIRSIYEIDDPDLADEFVTRLASDLQDRAFPLEVRSLGRTLRRWKDHIVAWHRGRATNGPTEAVIQQPHKEDQADRLWVSAVQVLQSPGAALRRQTQLGPISHRHPR
ncbi:MAG: ISL3 family transposase [Acidimicrobiia bacterium]|nr:ISL3 family transposase [Acidimicrobiia bacterium]